MVLITNKIHRKYPSVNWEFKAISAKVDDNGVERELVYGVANGIFSLEMYTGVNYIVGAKNKSRSRRYLMNEIPKKYKDIVEVLKKVHESTKWSDDKYVNLN
jgi:RNA-splicing ligase RtcB